MFVDVAAGGVGVAVYTHKHTASETFAQYRYEERPGRCPCCSGPGWTRVETCVGIEQKSGKSAAATSTNMPRERYDGLGSEAP